jgi:hypothetical protein
METTLDAKRERGDSVAWEVTMSEMLRPEYLQRLVGAYEEFRGARQSAAQAEAEFQPYKEKQLADRSAIQKAFLNEMDSDRSAGGQNASAIADKYARALEACEKWSRAAAKAQEKKQAMEDALARLAVSGLNIAAA